MANAIVMAIIAAAFLAAWTRQREASYWLNWTAANILLSGSMIACMLIGPGLGQAGAPVAMVLIVAGFGLRWRAARQFGLRSAPWFWPVVAPTTAIALGVLLPQIVPYATVYGAHNGIAAILCAATGWEFWRDREDRLASRYGLVVSYYVMALGFGLRTAQGMTVGYEMDHLLPRDLMLSIHLTFGIVHIVSAGAFALSLAYERNAEELRRLVGESNEAAHTDALTGLPNRRAFEALLTRQAGQADRRAAIALFDIDHFKAINDRHGHAAGDTALRACAETIRSTLGGAGILARIGGEEFAVLLTGIAPDEARARVERMREAVAATPIVFAGQTVSLTVSVGLFHTSTGFGSFDHAIGRADASLYAAKHAGRNRVEIAA